MRMRLVGWTVQPVIMADDGENLTPVQVQGQMIPASQWESFKAGGDLQALAPVRLQIEGVSAMADDVPATESEAGT